MSEAGPASPRAIDPYSAACRQGTRHDSIRSVNVRRTAVLAPTISRTAGTRTWERFNRYRFARPASSVSTIPCATSRLSARNVDVWFPPASSAMRRPDKDAPVRAKILNAPESAAGIKEASGFDKSMTPWWTTFVPYGTVPLHKTATATRRLLWANGPRESR